MNERESRAEERHRRFMRLLKDDGIQRDDFCNQIAISINTYYAWTAPQSSSRSHPPSVPQLHKICEVFGWSPTWIMFGLGPKRLDDFDFELPEKLRQIGEIAASLVAKYQQPVGVRE